VARKVINKNATPLKNGKKMLMSKIISLQPKNEAFHYMFVTK